ncbi:hypothetical protein SCLCIDRAFT_33254 [Scleroderma citrinum Foug A]|uniref:Uncharacterized protein n=1 Tax=Scleroderma citrinum Foug A TaxID=1036808 RepID=A0A0C3D6H4_9AGAM|nr:hypothetical protein SCLCIDRAFT_33254 [Scleroderma citrinum Foug A]
MSSIRLQGVSISPTSAKKRSILNVAPLRKFRAKISPDSREAAFGPSVRLITLLKN